MPNNYLKILQELEKSGAGEKRDISILLLQLFPKPLSKQDNDVENSKKPAIAVLNELEINKHILYNTTDLHYIGVKEGNYENWFTNSFNVSITILGLQYLHSQVLSESILESTIISTKTNKMIQKSIPIQIGLSFLTFVIALLTGWIAWLTYESTRHNEGHEKRLQSLEENIQGLKVQQYQDTIPKVSNSVKKKYVFHLP